MRLVAVALINKLIKAGGVNGGGGGGVAGVCKPGWRLMSA